MAITASVLCDYANNNFQTVQKKKWQAMVGVIVSNKVQSSSQ